MRAEPGVLDAIRRRRAVWRYRPGTVDRQQLSLIAEAAAYAPSADDVKGVSIIAIDDPSQLAAVIALSPGILGEPTAALVLCIDWDRRARLPAGARSEDTAWFDVGAAAENALLAAEGLELGATPITSFHQPAVAEILSLPSRWTPLAMIAIGPRRHRLIAPRPEVLEGRLHWQQYRP